MNWQREVGGIRESIFGKIVQMLMALLLMLMNAPICCKLWGRILEKATRKQFIFDSTEEENGRVPNKLLVDMVCEMLTDIKY